MKRAVDLGFVPSCIGKPYTFHGLLRGHDLDLLDQVASRVVDTRGESQKNVSQRRSLPRYTDWPRLSPATNSPFCSFGGTPRRRREMLMIRK